jgi:hypothetical protein
MASAHSFPVSISINKEKKEGLFGTKEWKIEEWEKKLGM